MEVVRREFPADFLKLVIVRPGRAPHQMHVRLLEQFAAFAEIARAARGNDVFPRRPTALGARNDMVEGQILRRAAIGALKPVAQEDIEAGKGRRAVLRNEILQRDHAGQIHFERRGMDLVIIFLNDLNALQEDSLHGFLPRPQR